jgi:beta-lactamase class A
VFDGVVGCFVARLAADGALTPIVELRADDLFPTASLIKVPLLLATFSALERGALDWHAPLRWDATRAARDGDRTQVHSRVPGHEAAWREWGWGQTTPREMAELLALIRARRAVSPAADVAMERALGRSFWTGEAIAPLPPEVPVLSKQGAVSASRSEVLLVDAPSGPYLFCAITRQQADTRYDHDHAGFVLLRDLSALAWDWFEPGSAAARPAPDVRNG